PYLTHYYLCYYEANILKGYIIYTIQDRIIYIIDILAENKNISIFKRLIERLKDESHKQHYSQIKCYTASKNKFLIDILRDSKLIDFKELFSIKKSDHNNRPTQIFVYVSDEVNTDQNLWENQHWYITDLIKEGRPYTSRLIG
ncbi:MAG: hypothetical protein U9Q77_09480, partial [Candidatus Marinimicrobia bacterium]|nr:hypothetical protein [Candidatus Neomarinimicrobiota bacterium]